MNYQTAGLSASEYQAIVKLLGREPNPLELSLIGVMWSEHCSYKSTRPLLRQFPQNGPYVVQGPGENAGVVEIGPNWGLAFKVESHNHPSAVAPYQGAATGVGGIIRDILAMGARPAVSMDGLFFGDPELPKTRRLAAGVVEGIGGYGNAVGVPTVGGKTFYDPRYNDNPLVNAFCAGFVPLDKLVSSKTAGPGDLAVLLGSKTGRDGIAGASFASKELDDDARSSRPQIQIGDPFEEKLLIECCLDLLDQGLIASMQDMGAAGILSSSSEIAYKSDLGINIHCQKIPLREADMAPWEIFLSESQERMLLILAPEKWPAVAALAKRYGLDCAAIGEMIPEKYYRVYKNGRCLADLPVSILGDAPELNWPAQASPALAARGRPPRLPLGPEPAGDLIKLLSSPEGREKRAIWEQYDYQVQLRTVLPPGYPVAAVETPAGGALIVMAMEAEPRKCWTDPFLGAQETMAQALRNIWLSGAEPLGMTNCLNFPSPEDPEKFHNLSECVRGLAQVCRDQDCPVVSGNVSLYNETPSGGIYPTPLVVVAGLVKTGEDFLKAGRSRAGDLLFLVGPPEGSLGASRWQVFKQGQPQGRPWNYQAAQEKDFGRRALAVARARAAGSGRVLAGGGLALGLALEVIHSKVGLKSIPPEGDMAATMFGEGGPRAIYAVPPEKIEEFAEIWRGYPITRLGRFEGDHLEIGNQINLPRAKLEAAFRGSAF